MLPSTSDRNLVFISKGTPIDNEFVLWLAPKLEAAGYEVFADILVLDGGDLWRDKLTNAIQKRSAKFLLCCSDETLKRRGVREEIGIAEEVAKELGEPNFIVPLKLREFKKVFGIAELQYIDFEAGWAGGLEELLESLEKQGVPRSDERVINPQWEQYRRRGAVTVEDSPEILTSNWLRIVSAPDVVNYVEPKNPCTKSTMLKLGRSFSLPCVPFQRGFLTFASPLDMEEHFAATGPFEVSSQLDLSVFLEEGAEKFLIKRRAARNYSTDLFRQAWEKFCGQLGYTPYEFSNGLSFHVGDNKTDLGTFVPWGRQGEVRRAMLRNKSEARRKVWEYGVNAIPNLFPFPHMRLKGRVLFSELERGRKSYVIRDTDKQFRLRRSVCSGWRNKTWHGRLMAFMELLAGDSPYVSLPVGGGANVVLDAMPIQFRSPVTARSESADNADGEEDDPSVTGFPVNGDVD